MFSTLTHTVASLYARIPGFLGDHVTLSAFLTIAAGIGILGYARKLWKDGAPITAADDADADDHLRALRITAEDEQRADWGWTGPTPVRPVQTLDARTAELVVDPTLKAADVPTIIEHMAHGAGSLADAAAAEAGTHLRTPSEEADYQSAWDLAIASAPAEEEEIAKRAFMAEFNGRLGVALEGFRAATLRADTWFCYEHGETDPCPHCALSLPALSPDYRARTEHTGEIDRRALEAMLAAV